MIGFKTRRYVLPEDGTPVQNMSEIIIIIMFMKD
jgi:hypothetical protein